MTQEQTIIVGLFVMLAIQALHISVLSRCLKRSQELIQRMIDVYDAAFTSQDGERDHG